MKDKFGRDITYLRVSITDLCNLRCRYCMPEEGVPKKKHADLITQEELIKAIQIAVSLGIKKIRITGGEPLSKPNIIPICEQIAAIPHIDHICITTNGTFLPKYALALKSAGVTRVNISMDTLVPEKYRYITRVGQLDDVLQGIDSALSVGFEKIKINAVLIGGFNDDEIPDLCRMTEKYPVDMRFIELMPMSGNFDFDDKSYVSGDIVLEKMPELVPVDLDGGVARLYKLPSGQGRIGIINPISSHFCGTCNRLRLMSDGKIKPCLHTSQEFSVKGLDDEGMRQQFLNAIEAKPARHPDLSKDSPSQSIRNMNEIGG